MNPIPLVRSLTLDKWNYGIELLLQSNSDNLIVEKIREWCFYVVKTSKQNKFLLVTLRNNIVVDEIIYTYKYLPTHSIYEPISRSYEPLDDKIEILPN